MKRAAKGNLLHRKFAEMKESIQVERGQYNRIELNRNNLKLWNKCNHK